MSQELQDAINRLNAAMDEFEKRKEAKKAAVAIGASIGTAVSIWRSAAQIDAMTVAEIDAWAATVESYDYSEVEES